MAREWLELSCVPVGEDCQQVGMPSYDSTLARSECSRFKAMLEAKFPMPEGCGAYYRIKGNAHDFGTYYEVAIYFDDRDELAIDYAYFVENNLPERWTDTDVMEYKPAEREEYSEIR